MFKTFEQVFNSLFDTVKKTLESISENRRDFVRYRAANALMFRAATSFMWWQRNTSRNESSLNEALELRASAMELYGDDEERIASDIEGIITNLSPENPVSTRKSKKCADKQVKSIRDRLKKHKAEIDETKRLEREFLEDVIPKVQGFLQGAKYDRFDVAVSEMAQDRAKRAIIAAVEAIRDRVHRDVILCGTRAEEAAEKLELSDTFSNKQSAAHWEGEFILAEADLEAVEAVIKSEGLTE